MASNQPGGSGSGSFREPLPCRYFANHGFCRDGPSCRRSHNVLMYQQPNLPNQGTWNRGGTAARTDQRRNNTQICYYFNHGGCRFGSSCRNLHIVEDDAHAYTGNSKSGASSSVTVVTNIVAELNLSGTNSTPKPGDETPASSRITGQVDEQNKENVNQEPKKENTEQASSSNSEGQKKSKEDERECGVCFDKISEKSTAKASKYGILENCRHVFCIECILKWRKEHDYTKRKIKTCPECRVESDFVLRSSTWIEDEANKNAQVRSCKNYLSKQPCRFFKQGRGHCKDGRECLYSHTYPDGRVQDKSGLPSRNEMGIGYLGDDDDDFDYSTDDDSTGFYDLDDDIDYDSDNYLFWDSDDEYFGDPLNAFLHNLLLHN